MAADEFPAHKVVNDLRQDTASFLAELAEKRRHHIACSLVLDHDVTVRGINVVSNLGPATACAEQVALGESLKNWPKSRIILVLTLRATFDTVQPDELVPPCGRCRELLVEYAPTAKIVLPDEGQNNFELVPVGNLLPNPFRRRTRRSN